MSCEQTEDFCIISLNHLTGQEFGSVVKNDEKIFVTVFPIGLLCRSGLKKIAIFDQYIALSQKQYKIGQLPWKTTRTSYAIYRMVPFSMTLNDPNSDFKGTSLLGGPAERYKFELSSVTLSDSKIVNDMEHRAASL